MKKSKGKKTKEKIVTPKEVPTLTEAEQDPVYPLYPCVNCGFRTNGDFMCKCGEVLCESCSDKDCNTCQEKYEDEVERKWRSKDWMDSLGINYENNQKRQNLKW